MKATFDVYRAKSYANIYRDEVFSILTNVALYTNIPLESITTPGRQRDVADAKHIARYMLYHYTHNSMLKVVQLTGGTNHATTINSLNACEDMRKTNKSFRNVFNQIESVVKLSNEKVVKLEFKPRNSF
jgi:chromosomal replication initiation ATPase DnaA